MAFLAHYFSALVYLTLGYVVAFLLPQAFPEIGEHLGYAYGGIVTLLLLLLHTLRTLGSARGQLGRRIEALNNSLEATDQELDAARKEIIRLREALTAIAKKNTDDRRDSDELQEVVAEVRVLQDLIARLSAAEPRAAAHPAAPAGAPPAEAAAELVPGPEAAPDRAPDLATPPPPDAGGPFAAAAETRFGRRQPQPPGESGLPPVASELDEAAILQVVREGLKSDRVELVLQPIVKLPQRKRRFYECFSRIHDGAGRIVVPEQYLEIARKSGLIAPIDNMLLFRCVQLIRRVRKAQQDVGFFCNISSYSLADTPFLRDFITFMAENVELAPNLVFEFAQTDIADMSEDVATNLQRLADLGFRFSMDQVGGLNMDYAELARHSFRFVKVEAARLIELVRAEEAGAAPQPQAGAFTLRDFIARLERVNMDLVVEKIESEKDLVELLDYNIDFGQGYLFGEPRRARPAA